MARRTALPGFGLALGYTLVYLSLIVLVPLSALAIAASELTAGELWRLATSERALATYRLTFGASFVAALVDVVFGTLVAWVLVRYRFPGRRVIDAIIDVPFALPTAVSGLALTAVFAKHGWLGGWLDAIGIEVAYTSTGIAVALAFIGLPFVVRTVQPVLEELGSELEEAALVLGATRWQTMRRVILPVLVPPMITGFALAFARAIGEYGSVVFISNNRQFEGEITPMLVMSKLDQHDHAGATALALVMLAASFVLLLAINSLGAWTRRRVGHA